MYAIKTRWPILLLVAILSGCATSAAQQVPKKPRAVALAPTAVTDTRSLETIGVLLAALSILQRTDTHLQSAFTAQVSELSESERASFADARRSASQAANILASAHVPSAYQGYWALLEDSDSAYAHAASEGLSNVTASRHDGATAAGDAQRVSDDLVATGVTTSNIVLSAKKRALSRVEGTLSSYFRAHPTPTPRRHSHRRPRSAAQLRRTLLPTATSIPIPTAVRRLTTRHRTRHTIKKHAHRRPRIRRVRPIARRHTQPAPQRKLPTPISAPPTVTATISPLVADVRASVDMARVASAQIDRCFAMIDNLASGTDATGSTDLRTCLVVAQRAFHSLASRLGKLSTRRELSPTRLHLSTAANAASNADDRLGRSQNDIDSGDIVSAQTELSAVRADITVIRANLS